MQGLLTGLGDAVSRRGVTVTKMVSGRVYLPDRG